jgi:cysteine desulfurase
MSRTIYFDYAAATPLAVEVLQAMQPYQQQEFYNPSASYLAAKAVKIDIDEARSKISGLVGARPAEIIFTSGATEANNLAIAGIREAFPDGQILSTNLEHDSVRQPAAKAGGQLVNVTKDGLIDLEDLKKNINDQTVLVSLMLVNNELGTIQPVREVAAMIELERKSRLHSGNKLPIYLHTDAAQAGNYFDLHVSRLGVDLMSVNGGKMYGPKQTGFLYIRAGAIITPQIIGGSQEFGVRSGTENVAGIIGLSAAFAGAQNRHKAEAKRVIDLRRKLEQQLLQNFSDAQINGAEKHRAPHLLNISFGGQDNERLMMELDELGIMVATGSACSAGKGELSHVLAAIGLPKHVIQSSLRISLGRDTTEESIKKLIGALKQILSNSSALQAKAL